jgi:hypothetical protein
MIPTAIVIHCSASKWGDAATFRSWHLENGWADIGYHAVILNGRRLPDLVYDPQLDGATEPGRAEDVVGAHCKAENMNLISLGVCLVGDPRYDDQDYPTAAQMETLIRYLAEKCIQYNIDVTAITQHSDHEPLKPFCASVNIPQIRQQVAKTIGI